MAKAEGSAKLLAGGQSLGPMLNLRLARPSLLVDVSRLEALARVDDIGSAWRIGAGVTHSRIEDMRGRLAGGEMLCEVAAGIAYRAIRNRGTIGGSVAHADPAADWPLALAALGATINIRGVGGARAIPVEQFVLGAFTTALRDDEIIETIDVPKLSRAGRYGYYKFCRKTGEFAEASAAAVFDPETGAARVYLAAVRPVPVPLGAIAQRVAREGKSAASEEVVARVVAEAASDLDPVERRMAAVRRDARLAAGVRAVTPIALTVNGRTVQALVEPRTHLADFLREHCRLTGTHLGCEHGVCGACTVLIAGAPARSCITYAIACDGLAIQTIEGFDDDPTMADLREAFSREHALQCGFCTPGMLIASRDIVQRLPDADERRIRVELSGNLCRCTGYRGIVNAVRSVVEVGRTQPAAAEAGRVVAPAATRRLRLSSPIRPMQRPRRPRLRRPPTSRARAGPGSRKAS